MNRILVFIILISVLAGCDTSTNVAPLGEEYFIKFYGSLGDQEGVAIKPTADGGFIIGGNSTPEFGGQLDYLLIKVDALGNQEWQETFDINGSGENDLITDISVDGDNFIIVGTSTINGVDKVVLIRVDNTGAMVNVPVVFDEFSNISYKANGLSVTSTGNFIITGPITGGDPTQYGKSFMAIINTDFMVVDSFSHPSNPSTVGNETIFVKGLEVINSNTSELNYLFFGYKNSITGSKLELAQFQTNFGSANNNQLPVNYNNSKVVDVVKINDSEYKLLAASDNSTYLINVEETSFGYVLAADQLVDAGDFIQGVSLAYSNNDQFLISSNTRPESSIISSSSILESSISGIISWERLFGTEISYTSGGVITLADGSVVYTGTAGFKGQKKCFLVKLKPNGEMK